MKLYDAPASEQQGKPSPLDQTKAEMSLNVKLSAPHLPELGTSKPEDPRPEKFGSDAPKSDDDGPKEVSLDVPMAKEGMLK